MPSSEMSCLQRERDAQRWYPLRSRHQLPVLEVLPCCDVDFMGLRSSQKRSLASSVSKLQIVIE